MSKIQVTVNDLGAEEEVKRRLLMLGRRGILMRNIGLMAERETKLNFAREASPDDEPWAPLAPSTIAQKGSDVILRKSSTLAGGISMTSASKDQATVQATAGSEYGLWHQTGTSKMPARPFIGIGPRIREKAQTLVNNWWGE